MGLTPKKAGIGLQPESIPEGQQPIAFLQLRRLVSHSGRQDGGLDRRIFAVA